MHSKKKLGLTVSDSNSKKISKTDLESGCYHKGKHKEVFSYSEQVVFAYTSHLGNEYDSRSTVKALFDKLTRKQ